MMRAAVASLLWMAAAVSGQPPGDAADAHARKGLQYAQSGDLARAEAELRRAVELAPNDSSYLTSLGGILGMEHKLAEANIYFERAVKADPGDATALRNLAANEWQLHRLPQAREHLERLLRMQPEDKTAKLLRGMVAENQRDYAQAAKLLAAVPELVAQHAEAVGALANAYYHTGQRQEARRALETLAGAAATPQGIFVVAGVAARAEDYGAAEKLLLEVTHSGRATGEMYGLLGWCYQKESNWSGAAQALRDAIRLEPDKLANYLELTAVLMRERQYPAALEVARRVTEKFPQSAAGYVSRGEAEMKAREYSDAVASYRRAVEMQPQSLDARIGLAAAERSAGMRAEGEAAFQELVNQHPDEASVYERYGTLLAEAATDASVEQRAGALLRKAIALNTSSAEAHYQLGLLELKRAEAAGGSMATAREQLEQAAKLRPEDSRIHFALAQLYRRLGRKEDAAREMQLYQQWTPAGER